VPTHDPESRLPGPSDEKGWLVLSFLLATGVAVLDAMVGSEVILIGLLVIPPIVASMRAGMAGTALIAGYCFALAIDAGVWDEFFLSADHLVRVLVIAIVGGLAVWVAQLRERISAARRGAGILAEAGKLAEDLLEEDAAAERIARLAVPDLADVSVINRIAEDGSIAPASVAARMPEDAELIRKIRARYPIAAGSDHPLAEAIRSGRTLVFSQIPDALLARHFPGDGEQLRLARELGPRSSMVVPVRAGGQIFGAMTFYSLQTEDRYGPGEIALAEELAHRAAIAIENARLHKQQAHIARTLQRSLLPASLPAVPGFDVAARFRPQGGQVGGDFYDLYPGENGAWIATIGDVCGKGPEAAALTSLSRHTLRASILHEDSPCETLKVLNAALLHELSEPQFCTAVYARIEPNGSGADLKACSGGHPPPLVLRRSGSVEVFTLPGTLLGVFEDPLLEDAESQLGPGDALILYTDGVVEARTNSATRPLPIEEVVQGCAGMDAAGIVATIEAAAVEAHGGAPRDDMALLAIRMDGMDE
jgi:serine phosphatase RsbU (regulator of sigma subunit)